MKTFADEHQLAVVEKPKHVNLEQLPLGDLSPFSVAVVVSFGHFLPGSLLRRFDAAINMHPSLLPQYRGAAPIYRALLDDRASTGVSVITLDDKEFDAGRVLWQQPVTIERHMRYKPLASKLARIGAGAVLQTLDELSVRLARGEPQTGVVSMAPRIAAADRRLRWAETRAQVYSRWRALGDTFGVHTLWRGKRLKIVEMLAPDDSAQHVDDAAAEVGAVRFDKRLHCLQVRCSDGWLCVTRVCVQDKSAVSAQQFAVGYRLRAERFR